MNQIYFVDCVQYSLAHHFKHALVLIEMILSSTNNLCFGCETPFTIGLNYQEGSLVIWEGTQGHIDIRGHICWHIR